jgi:Leucine-rich repeat (LRR) protein
MHSGPSFDPLTNLTRLYLADTHVTDSGLAHLKDLSKLSIFG